MYTQCPECEIAFKVTADVLKQAAGKVRCGGCGNAFNALAYLSEQMPKQPVAAVANSALPELTPEIIDTDSGLPQSISAEQSAALLKTLDELAGSDIRIEDTGVEWRVLDELEAAEPAADDDNADIEADANAVNVDELRFDDNTPLPDDFGLGGESSYTAESPPVVEDEVDEGEAEEPNPEIVLSDPGEWADILGEFQVLAQEVTAPPDIETDAIEDDDDVLDDDPAIELSSADQPLDMDTQFALQAEAMGIDVSGINELEEDYLYEEPEFETEALGDDASDDEPELKDEVLEDSTELEDEDPEDEIEIEDEEPEDDVEFEDEELKDSTEPEDQDVDDEPELEDEEVEDEPELEDEEVEDEPELEDEEVEDEPELEDEEVEDEPELEDEEVEDELIEEPIIESHTIEDELALGSVSAPENDDAGAHYVPPMTEEEHTVNMQIDQDLMALAIEDDDGFASTIVIPAKDTEENAHKENGDPSGDDGENETETADDNIGFETIIMEGESIRSALDDDKFAADAAAAAKLAEHARAQETGQAKQSGERRYGIIAGIGALVLLLAVQLVHQSRESLATIPAFSSTISTIYRAIGQPVQPAWDITGWRFEVTTSSTDGESDELTVYSRLGNSSDGPLPYPLISISLADRFEETLGSRVLDPGDYLPTDLDPRKLVKPGSSFNAIITIKSASEEATSFNLKVCYRMTNGQLRCKDDSFLR